MTLFDLLSGRFQKRFFLIGLGLILFSLLTSASAFPIQTNFQPSGFFDISAAQSCDQDIPVGYVQTITGLVEGDELSISISSRFGGAVESLIWRGKEFINIFDHGRQISYAWHLDGYGECFNPTEPGSASDLFAPTSTSQLLEVCLQDANRLTTKTQPAYWLAPGETGFCDGGAVTAVNDTPLSNNLLEKTIEIGYMGLDNVIAFTAEVALPEDHDVLQLEIPTGYLTYEFTNYWVFDPLSGEVTKPESQALQEPWSYVHHTNLPPILATEDGQYAMGAYTDEDILSYSILMYDVPNPADRTNKWNIVLREEPAPAGTYTYESFAIVGTLEQVTEAMALLYELRPTDIAPPMGFVDVANCTAIDGWAWDPKTPNEPIEIEIREANEDGTETLLGRYTADQFREDLPPALGDNGIHAFTIPTSELLHDGDSHTIRVYGLNSNPNLSPRPLQPLNTELTCPQFSPTSAPPPTETAPPPPTSLPTATTVTQVETPTATLASTTTAPTNDDNNGGCIGSGFPLLIGLTFVIRRRRSRSTITKKSKRFNFR